MRYIIVRIYSEIINERLGITRRHEEKIECKTLKEAKDLYSILSDEEIENGSYILDTVNNSKINV